MISPKMPVEVLWVARLLFHVGDQFNGSDLEDEGWGINLIGSAH